MRRIQSVIIVEGDVARVELTRGKWAIIDASDIPLVAGRCWHAIPAPNDKWYARSGAEYMHRRLTNAPPDKEVDHGDNDGLNNRLANLRVCTHKENMENGRFALTGTCPKGHAYDDANTYLNGRGGRICRSCNADRAAARIAAETPEQREQRRAYAAMSYQRSRDRRIAQSKAWAATRKDEKREYDRRRRERLKAEASP